jgi:hypothetical protein
MNFRHHLRTQQTRLAGPVTLDVLLAHQNLRCVRGFWLLPALARGAGGGR